MPTLQHLIVSFRPMLNVSLTLAIKDATVTKIQLQTLVLPCLPATSDAIDILDLDHLKILDIGLVNVRNRMELSRLDHMLAHRRYHSLVNLTLSLNEWQHARLTVLRKGHSNSRLTTDDAPFDSIFANCFEPNATVDEGEEIREPFASDKVASSFPILCRYKAQIRGN